MKKKKTLRRKIYLVIALNLLVIAFIYSLILFPLENTRRRNLINEIELTIHSIVVKYEDDLANEIFLDHKEAVELILRKMRTLKGIIAITVYDWEGGAFFGTDKNYTGGLVNFHREKASEHYSFVKEKANKRSVLSYEKSIMASGEHTGYINVYYDYDEVVSEYRRDITIFTILLLTILLSVSWLLNMMLSRSVIRPVGRLSAAMKKVQQGELGEQVELSPDDEIGEMAEAFNTMSAENARMYKELENVSQTLDLKVKERTKELITADREVVKEMGEHKKALIALEKEKSYLDNLFDNAPEAIFVGDNNAIVQRVNSEFIRLFGYTKDEAVGQNIDDLIAPGELREEAESITEHVLECNKVNFESTRKRKDGKRIHVSVLISPIIIDNKQVASYAIYRDITARKKAEEEKKELEEQLQQSQKMEAIGLLAGGVAHDFNNMLAVITGFSEMIKRKFAEDDPTLNEYTDRILNAAMSSADLVAKLLAFARKGRFKVVEADVNFIIQTVVGLLEHTSDKRINLIQKLKADDAVVMGDITQLQNAILNIAINAIDAMPNGGKLTFAADIVNLDKKYRKHHSSMISPGTYVQITITDTGIGMSEETIKRIFEPFFTTKEPGKGTGLGLASVFGTIENHKGIIGVKSEVGKGTTFKIHLPLKDTASEDSNAVSDKILRGSGKILIVDDEEEVRHMFEHMLSDLGYTTVTCANGEEAVEYYKKQYKELDLVILDVMMPELNGYDCYVKLKKTNPDIKAIITSGYSDDEGVNEIIEKGALGFIQKPFNINQLSRAVHEAIDTSSRKSRT